MEGMGSLNVLSTLGKHQCKFDITDNQIDLPAGFVRFLALRGQCNTWTEAELLNNPLLVQSQNSGIILYADTTFLTSCGCDTAGWNDWMNSIQINNGVMHFNGATEMTSATMAYMGLNVDENGNALIYERYERALASYASWKYTNMYFEKFNQYIIDGYKQEWMAQASRIKGEDVANDFQNDKFEISNAVSGLLTSKVVNILP